MGIYTYGIINSNNEIEDKTIRGLKGISIYNIPYRDIGIVVSNLNEQIQDITRAHVMAHEEVLEKLMENFTILPMRFLTVFNTKKTLLSMMENYYIDFKKNIDRLHNKVEFGIKVIWSGDMIREHIIGESIGNSPIKFIAGDSPVKNFVKEKFKEYKIDEELEKKADRCIGAVDKFFSTLATEKKLEKMKTNNLLLNAYYLVEKNKQSDFKEAFERLRSTTGGLKYLFSGPWPPYNFVTLRKNRSNRVYLTE